MKSLTARQIVESLKGLSGVGDLLREYGKMVPSGGSFVIEPGDYLRQVGNQTLSITAPIAYDIWYLFNHVSLIDKEDDPNGYVEQRLAFLSEKLLGIKPLRGVRDQSQILTMLTPTGWYYEMKDRYYNVADYWIQDMPYEFGHKYQGLKFPSDYPKGADIQALCGYLAFPVGQLGVMENISLLFESETDGDDFRMDPAEYPVTFPPGQGSLFPPAGHAGTNKCFGLQILRGGYLINDADGINLQVEQHASPIPEHEYGADVSPKSWMRFWLHADKKYPVPGEFVGVLTKPLALPPHAWWFQESFPFLYAGNWWETGWVTSGIVTQRVLEEDRADEGTGDEYTVRVNGIEIIIYATDFFRYEVGERVAVVKVNNVSEDLPEAPFTGRVLKMQWNKEQGQKYTDYMIMPVSFYAEE